MIITPDWGTPKRHRQGIEMPRFPGGFLANMDPKLVDRPPTGPGWLHEVKFDGYRMQVHVRGGAARFYSRNGNDWTDRFELLRLLAGELEDCVLDCELCAVDAEGYSDFSSLRSKIFKAPDELTLFAFDILHRGDDDLRPYALTTRKAVLGEVLAAGGIVTESHFRFVEPVPGEGPALLKAACELRWEGIVSKRLDSIYKAGRTESWVKSKCRPSESIVIGAYVVDQNGRFRYLLGGVREPRGLRYVGSIKGGFGGGTVEELLPRLRPLESDRSPFDIDSPKPSSLIRWLRPELIAEVEMAEFTGSGKLRQASFKGLREDLG